MPLVYSNNVMLQALKILVWACRSEEGAGRQPRGDGVKAEKAHREGTTSPPALDARSSTPGQRVDAAGFGNSS